VVAVAVDVEADDVGADPVVPEFVDELSQRWRQGRR
jgi:hypothetical protein